MVLVVSVISRIAMRAFGDSSPVGVRTIAAPGINSQFVDPWFMSLSSLTSRIR